MSRDVAVSTLVTGHFPVFENDGVSKHSGLLSTDFTATVYHNSAPAVLAVSVSEIGTSGEYQYTFTPTLIGVYDVEIFIHYNNDIWHEQLISMTAELNTQLVAIKGQADKIDVAPTLGPATVVSGSLMDRTLNKSVAKSYNQGTDSLEAIRDRMG